jgi:hypothetical protein
MAQLDTLFECEECNHEWSGNPDPTGHAWETCPNCGADDGDNCWDCGINVVEDGDGGEMCTACRRALCWDCTGGRLRSYRSPHKDGREEDNGRCGTTVRVL